LFVSFPAACREFPSSPTRRSSDLGLDDLAGPEGRRLEQCAVDLLGPRRERRAEHEARELVVDEHRAVARVPVERDEAVRARRLRSEEHTSELQSREKLVCRLLLEK